MNTYKVWDPLVGAESLASEVEAYTTREAAIAFALGDVEGRSSALYQFGRELLVRCPNGALVRWEITEVITFVAAKHEVVSVRQEDDE